MSDLIPRSSSTSPDPRRRVAIYARTNDAPTLKRQRAYVEEFIVQQPEWTVVGCYEDTAPSTTIRPALRQLLVDGKNGDFELVIARDISRLGRGSRTW